ncbi:hypothetical protein Tco_1481476, partial [Tanacetum coccineum]
IMGEPLSPNRMFDFPVDEPEPHPAYDFFAPGPVPGWSDGWPIVDMDEVEEQVVALVVDMDEDIAMLFGGDDFGEDESEEFDKEEVWEVNEDWLMAPVTPPPMPVVPPPSAYEVGGNLEYVHGQLVKKMIQVSDAEVEAGVIIREIGLRVFSIEGQLMASQMVHAADRFEQISA